jgi:hypothetical protein
MSASVITVILKSFSIKETPYGGQISASVFMDNSMLAVAMVKSAWELHPWVFAGRSRSCCVFPCAGATRLTGISLVA